MTKRMLARIDRTGGYAVIYTDGISFVLKHRDEAKWMREHHDLSSLVIRVSRASNPSPSTGWAYGEAEMDVLRSWLLRHPVNEESS